MAKRRVILCSVDGMRPDAVEAADTPTFDRLIQDGAYSPCARTVMPSVTLPCHMSMLRGVDPARHGVTTNTYQPPARPVPSLFDVARDHGKRTGFFYNWEELRDLSAPGKLDVAFMYHDTESPEGDRHVAETAVDYMSRIDFDLMMLYLGWTDACGHRHGWMSPEYLEAVSNADACLGLVLGALDRLGRADETAVLVQSDHGGHERSHGTESDDDMLIPWILSGPGVRAGHTIAGPVRIYDTCATLAHLLDIPASRIWDGRVIEEALEGGA